MTDKIVKLGNLKPNRKGRPRGARNKLSTNFLEDIHSYWSKRTNGANGTPCSLCVVILQDGSKYYSKRTTQREHGAS